MNIPGIGPGVGPFRQNKVSTSKQELKRYRKKSNDEGNQDMGYAPIWSTTGNN